MLDVFSKCTDKNYGFFAEIRRSKDAYFIQPSLVGSPGPHMQFNGKDVIVWSINNYLGFATRPELQSLARQMLDEMPLGAPMGSRILAGDTKYHRELEAALANFSGREQALLFINGYMGMLGILPALVGTNDVVIIDKESHACIVDGARLATASNNRNLRVYRHGDMHHLESILKSINKKRKGGILIASDGVFSMKGDVAQLPALCELKEKYGARLIIDDAHGFGVMCNNGRGTDHYFNLTHKVDLYFGTFVKSMASLGSFVAGQSDVIDYLKFNTRTNIFTKTLPTIFVRWVHQALTLLQAEPELIKKLWDNTKLLQEGLLSMNIDIGKPQSHITPIYITQALTDEDMVRAKKILTILREEFGIFVSGVTYPAVPRKTIILRLVPTAEHSTDDINKTLSAFAAIKARGLL